ncbi:hypothetical protein P7C70_g7232, partial [Phenoliferia sp. Uapishka_3]
MGTSSAVHFALVILWIVTGGAITAPLVIESPQWAAEHNPPLFDSATHAERSPLAREEGEDLDDDESGYSTRSSAPEREESLSIGQAISSKDPAIRRGLLAVVSAQFFQQGSGINAGLHNPFMKPQSFAQSE